MRPGRVAVALVSPQQSVNVGAVARLMATFGHVDLYISPQDGGYDAMAPGDMIVDFSPSNKTVNLQIAPLLSVNHGRDPKEFIIPSFEDTFDLPMPPILRFSDLPEDAPLSYFLEQIEADPQCLLPFLPTMTSDKKNTFPIKAYLTDRIGTRYSRTAAIVNSFFPHSRLCLEVPSSLIEKNTGEQECSEPKVIRFGFEVSRIGVPQFQGPPSAMWAPYHAAYTISHAMNSRNENLSVHQTEHQNVQLYINSQDEPTHTTGAEEPPSLFSPARLHPAVALSSASYFAATKSGAEVLDNAKLYYDLGDLMGKFDVVVGTSAMFKTPPKRISPIRSPVLKPWELDWVNLTNYSSDEVTKNPDEGPSMLVVLGRESSGLTARELDMCDYLVTIPGPNQLGGTNFSLNLGQACACILYEITRAQRVFTEVLEPASQIEEKPEADDSDKSKHRLRHEAMMEGRYRSFNVGSGAKMTDEGRASIFELSKEFFAQLDPRFTLHDSPTPSELASNTIYGEPPQFAGEMTEYYTNLSGIKELDQSHRDVCIEGRTAMHPTAVPHYSGSPVPPSGRSHAEDYAIIMRKILSRSNFTLTEAKAWINFLKWSTKQASVHRDTITELSNTIKKIKNRLS